MTYWVAEWKKSQDANLHIARHFCSIRCSIRAFPQGPENPRRQNYCSFSSCLFFTLRGEPDLWRKDLTASVKLWIDVSQPDEKRMRRACGRADEVYVYVYGGQGINLWWKKVATDVAHCANLTVVQLPLAACREMAQQAERNMKLNCTIQEG